MINYTEIPANIEAYSRIKNKTWNKGHKGNVWICSRIGYFGITKKGKCEECGEDIYFTPDCLEDLRTKNAKKICIKCILFNPKWKIHPEVRVILEKAYAYEKRKIGEM